MQDLGGLGRVMPGQTLQKLRVIKIIGADGGNRLLRFGVSWGWALGCEDLGHSEVLGIPECEEDQLVET